MTAFTVDHLPFTAVDEAIHHLDTPSEPWSIEVELAVAGRLDPVRLRWALHQAMARHPMARARCLPARRADRTYTWEVTPVGDLDPLSVVPCPDGGDLAEARDRLQSLSVPLAESPPFRVRLAHCRDGDSLLLNANHAAFDGFGCVRLLQSVARVYSGQADPVPDVDLADARDVERHLAFPEPDVDMAARARAVLDKVADQIRPTARLARDGGADEPGYRIVHRTLSPEDTRHVVEYEGATVDDLLVTGLHLATQKWNSRHGVACGRIGVLMPVNLRPSAWRAEMVTNFVLMARVATDRQDRGDARSALAAVAAQTDEVKRLGTGAALIEVLGRRRLPLWVKRSLSPVLWMTGNRVVDTARFSNLGTVADPPSFGPEVGDTVGLWFSAPSRLPCALSVGAATVAGRLQLSFRWRRPVVGTGAADDFADLYLGELTSLTGSTRPAA